MMVWLQSSQRATWPPSAAVRQPLDGAHRLHLVKAHVAGIGRTPSSLCRSAGATVTKILIWRNRWYSGCGLRAETLRTDGPDRASAAPSSPRPPMPMINQPWESWVAGSLKPFFRQYRPKPTSTVRRNNGSGTLALNHTSFHRGVRHAWAYLLLRSSFHVELPVLS